MKVPAHRLLAACLAMAAAPSFAQDVPADPAPPAAEPAPAPAPAPVAAEPAPAPAKASRPAAKPRPVAPRYSWVELDYRWRYVGEGDDRFRSDSGAGLAVNALIVPNFYFTAAFSQDQLDQGVSFPPFELQVDQKYQEWNAGFGGYVAVAPSTHLVVNGTYETTRVDTDGTFTDASDPTNNASISSEAKGDGFGLLLGVRTMLSPSSEFAAHYKRAELDGDYSDSSDEFELSTDTFAASLTTQFTSVLAVVLRIARSGSDVTDHEDTDFDGRVDTTTESRLHDEVYGIGLRVRF